LFTDIVSEVRRESAALAALKSMHAVVPSTDAL
jgi:hypothetical protein